MTLTRLSRVSGQNASIKHVIGTLALAALVFGFTPNLNAQSCSDYSLKGNYGYTVTGTITANSGPLIAGPFVAVGRLTFDGFGNVSTVRAFNDNGISLTNDAGSGTYNLKSDCTGTFNITVGPAGQQIELTLSMVLDDNFELRAVVTTKNVVLALDGKKQQPTY